MRNLLLIASFLFAHFSITPLSIFAQDGEDEQIRITRTELNTSDRLGEGKEGLVARLLVDENALVGLSEEARERLLYLVEQLAAETRYWSKYEVELPKSVFEGTEWSIEGGVFKQSPLDENLELERLAENRTPLYKQEELWSELKKNGRFLVDSIEFPGQKHVWQVKWFLQTGTERTKIKLQKRLASGVSELIIEIPATFFKRRGSLFRMAWNNIKNGTKGLVSSIIGLVEKKPEFTPYEINEKIDQKTITELNNRFLSEDLAPLRFGQPYDSSDSRNSDAFEAQREKHEKVSAIIEGIVEESDRLWEENKKTYEKTHLAAIGNLDSAAKAEGIDDKGIESTLREKMIDSRAGLTAAAILMSEELAEIDPNLPEELSRRTTTIGVVRVAEMKIEDEIQSLLETTINRLKKANPILSKNSDWLEEKTNEVIRRQYLEIASLYLEEAVTKLKEKNFKREAIWIQVQVDRLKARRNEFKELASKEVPAREFEWVRPISNPKSWEKVAETRQDFEEDLRGVSVLVKRKGFVAVKSRKTTTNTGFLLWRFRNAFERARMHFRAGVHWIWHENLLNGPLGLKSQLRINPFYSRQEMEFETGNIVPDEHSLRMTYSRRMKHIWDVVSSNLREYKESRSNGFLPRGVESFFVHSGQYLLGTLKTVIIGLGQPALTTVNTALSGTALLTSPAWAPLSSLLVSAFNLTIYDTEAPRDRPKGFLLSPIITRPLQIIFGAIGQGLIATTLKTAFHLGWGTTKIGYAGTAWTAQSAYDFGMRSTILRLARIPASNNIAIKRIGGPGISSQYFYEATPEIASIGIRLAMEEDEIYRIQQFVIRDIHTPADEFFRKYASYVRAFMSPDRNSDIGDQLFNPGFFEELQKANLQSVDQVFEERYRLLEKISDSFWVSDSWLYQDSVKLSQENLEKAIIEGARSAKAFYENRLFKILDKVQIKRFWEAHGLQPNDWVGLAKEKLSSKFGNGVLLSLEQSDREIRLEVEPPSIDKILSEIESGKAEIGSVTVPRARISSEGTRYRRSLESISAREINHRLLGFGQSNVHKNNDPHHTLVSLREYSDYEGDEESRNDYLGSLADSICARVFSR